MGGVNASPSYITEVGIGNDDGTVTDTTHEGGIISIYYLGCIFGCFAMGWLADRVGRINGLLVGGLFALLGGALQAAAQSSDWMLMARLVTGTGTGGELGSTVNVIGDMMMIIASSNWHHTDLGISVAYWLSFGLAFVNHGYSAVRWRFLLVIQCVPAIFLILFIKILPDSPRYLASVGRQEEARELLYHSSHAPSQDTVDREYAEIITAARYSKPSPPVEFFKILL
ncbi:hypothetical protein AbraIFM66950_007681 [Aspergillus brasiliensis]|nr:hypothetical protein AbraIFM66950_007681 [Aspergillus brasiliensis]